VPQGSAVFALRYRWLLTTPKGRLMERSESLSINRIDMGHDDTIRWQLVSPGSLGPSEESLRGFRHGPIVRTIGIAQRGGRRTQSEVAASIPKTPEHESGFFQIGNKSLSAALGGASKIVGQ
jgi:hypothetical protein